MKTIILFLCFILFSIIVISFSCRKKQENPCQGITKPGGHFLINELIGDTAFVADTIYRDNYVQFQTLDNYETVAWKLGSDPRTWTEPEFSLSFYGTLGNIFVNFEGKKIPNAQCFPTDNVIYTNSKNFTLVEQVEKPFLTLSPLIGKYNGYFTDNPTDTFTVRMEYFDSTKYDVTSTGSKNFYWFSNIPKGYISYTNAAYAYPELRNGFSVEMGYKCFVFGTGSNIVQGRAWLSHDTLYINYGNDVNGRKKFIGKKL